MSRLFDRYLLWPLLLIGHLLAASLLAWHLLAQVNFAYPVGYQLLDIHGHIQTFAPENRYKDHFEHTSREEHKRLFAEITRTTKETELRVRVDLDGRGEASVQTGIGFFDHMLIALARHGLWDLVVEARGDLHVDGHHTVEDTGIAIGQALAEAWGDRSGVERFGDATVPIDEALTRVAIDLSGRPYLVWDCEVPIEVIGTDFETSLVKHFFESVVANARITLHVHNLSGDNTHHTFESVFKAFAVALRRAVAVTGTGTPSTKGVLQ
jgi:imidazoleglycerol-phosphate dehydratase